MSMDTNNASENADSNSPIGINDPILAPAQEDSNKWLTWAALSSLLALGAFAYLLYHILNGSTSYNASNVGTLNQQISHDLTTVLQAPTKENFEKSFSSLETASKAMNGAIKDPQVIADNKAFVTSWPDTQKKIDFILQNKEPLAQINAAVAKVSEEMPKLQQQYRQLVEKMLTNGATANQVAIANNQVWLSEKINKDIILLRAGQTNTSEADGIKQLVQDLQQFEATIKAEQTGTDAIQKIATPVLVNDINAIAQTYNNAIKANVEQLQKLADVDSQLRQQANVVSTVSNQNANIATAPGAAGNSDLFKVWLPAALILLGFLAALYSAYRQLQVRTLKERKLSERETLRQRYEMEVESERARQIQEENERNQMAILRLLDELGDLAEGDLTVNATVSEDFTGAIADSVNFAIDQLRQLVSAINVTADRVAFASEQTQSTAVKLAEASENQAQEIAGASAAINEMAVSIDQVSSNAAESATVANRSVEIAYNGAEVVQRTIDGMNTIRDQIQDTSKRIKRLGESSQEIGDIVGLINDIADQTNILALNAAIQASMAGEAGRGFAVVADEVQRLAERSATATKQIETLVKTIQADTSEAVRSMESTTAEVVRGAKLAKDAGEALQEVQSVSNSLADLIQNISSAARQQAASAGHISNTMHVIQDITSQTTSGTLTTARSVGELNEMAASLQESVSGFKLPDEGFTHS